jgi:hypothetical protein
MNWPLRTHLAIAAVALLSIYNAAKLYVPEGTPPRYNFPIAELRERFQILDTVVPPHTQLGYVSDRPPDEVTIYGIEYAIAPRMLVKDHVPHRFVLGNFFEFADYAEFGRARGLSIVREFPKGVVLYERQAAP